MKSEKRKSESTERIF